MKSLSFLLAFHHPLLDPVPSLDLLHRRGTRIPPIFPSLLFRVPRLRQKWLPSRSPMLALSLPTPAPAPLLPCPAAAVSAPALLSLMVTAARVSTASLSRSQSAARHLPCLCALPHSPFDAQALRSATCWFCSSHSTAPALLITLILTLVRCFSASVLACDDLNTANSFCVTAGSSGVT